MDKVNHKMSVQFHKAPQFYKRLDKLRKSGGQAALAEKRAREIIDRFHVDTGKDRAEIHGLTRNGEARIDHCKKFDLGSGYRLIALEEKGHQVFLFIGTHDQCDRWLNHQKGLQVETEKQANTSVADDGNGPLPDPSSTEPEPDYDDLLMERIDEQMLRRIFKGLCNTQSL
jgi:hypothetical protein